MTIPIFQTLAPKGDPFFPSPFSRFFVPSEKKIPGIFHFQWWKETFFSDFRTQWAVRSCALESFSFATTKASSDSSALLKISPFPVFSQLCIKHSESLQHFWLFNLSFFPIFPLQKNLHFRLKNFSLIFTNFRNVLDTTNATNYKLLAHPKYFWQKQIKYFFFEIL